MTPVGALCALCALSAGDHEGGVAQISIMYGGSAYGHELVPLWKDLYLCDACAEVIRETTDDDSE